MFARGIRKRERGFTLIELGIVIGVIAVLATIVIVGRGFLISSRISKVVESVDSVQKAAKVYAGMSAGIFPNAASGALLDDLFNRDLLSFGNATEVVPDFTFDAAGHDANGRRFYVTITCATPNNPGLACDDIMTSKRSDRSFNPTGTINGAACSAFPPTGTTSITMCFDI
ncbi:MAG: type II secretion system protein [Myxococcota bacterium]